MPAKAHQAHHRAAPSSRDQTVEIQRARMLEAMAEIVAERGLHGTTIGAVVARARVSRVTFTEIFGNIEEAFVELVKQATSLPVNQISAAFERETSWRSSVLAGLQALLTLLDSEPALARVCLIDSLAGPPAALEHRARLLQPLVALVDGGRNTLPADAQPPPVTAEATVTAVAGVLHSRLVALQAPPFINLLGELAALVIAPYLGIEQAEEASRMGLARSKAIAREHSARPPHLRVAIPSQLHHARARRARACVLYVAENPGASNQTIAMGIGIRHVGQASTLLARLERLEVITKRAGGAGRPNSWVLSPRGEEIVRSLKRP